MINRVYCLWVLPFFLVAGVVLAEPDAEGPAQEASKPASARALYLSPSIGASLSSNLGSNVSGGFGFVGGVGAEFYFTPNLGLFTGLSMQGRKMTLNSSATPMFLNIPLGLAIQYKNPFLEGGRSMLGLGFYYGIPTSDFDDAGGAVALQAVPGVIFPFGTYFPVTEGFELGLYSSIRFGFGSPFSAVSDVLVMDVDLGIGARISVL